MFSFSSDEIALLRWIGVTGCWLKLVSGDSSRGRLVAGFESFSGLEFLVQSSGSSSFALKHQKKNKMCEIASTIKLKSKFHVVFSTIL
jgi:hypothetical protein